MYFIISLYVRDVTVTISNTVTLSWSTPYTLDNTYINGYNITITNTLTNEIETYFTESLQLSYQNGSNETNPCTEINVDIFAINTAGNGDISTESKVCLSIITVIDPNMAMISMSCVGR